MFCGCAHFTGQKAKAQKETQQPPVTGSGLEPGSLPIRSIRSPLPGNGVSPQLPHCLRAQRAHPPDPQPPIQHVCVSECSVHAKNLNSL